MILVEMAILLGGIVVAVAIAIGCTRVGPIAREQYVCV